MEKRKTERREETRLLRLVNFGLDDETARCV